MQSTADVTPCPCSPRGALFIPVPPSGEKPGNLPCPCSQTSSGGALVPQATGDRMPDTHVRLQACSEISLMQNPFGPVLLCKESPRSLHFNRVHLHPIIRESYHRSHKVHSAP